jgi:hypothetical protein
MSRSLVALLVRAALPLVALLTCGRALAYQNPTRFADPPEMGGGGGKFFTGSPADGYTCVVCHTAGTPAHLKIEGLPVGGYTPGQVYRITVDWDDTLKSVALNLEITDRSGQTLGEIAMPGADQLSEADLCNPISIGLPDLHVLMTTDNRMVAVVPECGGHQASVMWTAPTAPGTGSYAEAWFSGSLVAADMDGKVIGDNTTDFTRVIGLRAQTVPKASVVKGGCSVLTGRGQNASTPFFALLLVLGVLRRLRARAGCQLAARSKS